MVVVTKCDAAEHGTFVHVAMAIIYSGAPEI